MDREPFSRRIGFLRAGWWVVHLLGVTAVYTLGNLLWKQGDAMLRHFMRYKPGWWALHVVVVSLTFYLGHMASFRFQPMGKRTLFAALVLLAVAGLMLHLRIHYFMVPVVKPIPGVPVFGPTRFDPTRFLSFIFPLIDVVLVTLLFSSKKTAVYGYVLNGMIVIYGTVFMGHFSVAELTARSAPAFDWLGRSTLPDIAIAWGDFFVGKALYDSYTRG